MNLDLRDMTRSALGAVLIVLGAYISFPIFPAVPFTLQIFSVFLLTVIYRPVNSLAAVILYIMMGMAGLPVFAGAKGGAAYVLGPTGGFIIGFLIFPMVSFVFSKRLKALCVGFFLFYILGIFWLSFSLNLSFYKSLLTVWIFIPLDIIKLIAALLVGNRIRMIIR